MKEERELEADRRRFDSFDTRCGLHGSTVANESERLETDRGSRLELWNDAQRGEGAKEGGRGKESDCRCGVSVIKKEEKNGSLQESELWRNRKSCPSSDGLNKLDKQRKCS